MRRILRLAAQGILPAAVLFGAWAVTQSLINGDEAATTSTAAERAEEQYSVLAVDAEPSNNRASLRAFGEIVAEESADLRVASPGEVIAVHERLAVGKTVDEGAALVTVDPFLYEGALRESIASLTEARARLAEADSRIRAETAAIERAEEQLVLSERDLERAQRLAASGNTSDKAVDDRRLLVSQGQQTLDQRRFALEAEKAKRLQQAASIGRLEWQVQKARRALDDTVLRAPFKAIVRSEEVAVGKQLVANDVAVSLIRADALDVKFTLSDQRYGRLISTGALIGEEVDVIWRIGDQPLTYTATILRVAADIDRDSGGVDVFARLNLPDPALGPRPGAFVEVAVPGRLHSDSIKLPSSALYGNSVFVIGQDNRLAERQVSVLVRDGDDVIVRGAIDAGEPIVTTRIAEAGSGLLVRRVEPAPAPGPAAVPSVAERQADEDAAAPQADAPG